MGFIQTPVRKRILRKLANTKSLREARAKHKQWLKERGLDNLKPRKHTGESLTFEPIVNRVGVPTSDKVPVMERGIGSKKEEMRYTGKRKLVGIATMHKSNMVPVFADEDDKTGSKQATEIATMRRG